jgi:hypothetical protein
MRHKMPYRVKPHRVYTDLYAILVLFVVEQYGAVHFLVVYSHPSCYKTQQQIQLNVVMPWLLLGLLCSACILALCGFKIMLQCVGVPKVSKALPLLEEETDEYAHDADVETTAMVG